MPTKKPASKPAVPAPKATPVAAKPPVAAAKPAPKPVAAPVKRKSAAKVPAAAKPVPRPPPTRQEIATRAYEIWLEQGRPSGFETEHWLQAERELVSMPSS